MSRDRSTSHFVRRPQCAPCLRSERTPTTCKRSRLPQQKQVMLDTLPVSSLVLPPLSFLCIVISRAAATIACRSDRSCAAAAIQASSPSKLSTIIRASAPNYFVALPSGANRLRRRPSQTHVFQTFSLRLL